MKLSKILGALTKEEQEKVMSVIANKSIKDLPTDLFEMPELSSGEAKKEAIKFLNENFPAWVGIKRYIEGYFKEIVIHSGSDMAIVRFKADMRFQIVKEDLEKLKRLGLSHIRVNELNFIDLYFKIKKEYFGKHPLVLEINK